MNKDIIKGNWKEIKGKVKQQRGKLTNFNFIFGLIENIL